MKCKFCGKNISRNGCCQKYKDYKNNIKDIISYEKLYDDYIIKEMSINELKEKYNLSWRFIDNLLKEYNIEKRGLKEKGTNRWKNKNKNTCLKKYGTENVLSKESPVRKNMEMDILKKYGVQNVFQLEDIKNKIKNTCLEKYGTDHWLKNQENLERFKKNIFNDFTKEDWKKVEFKRKNTCLEKYGVDHPLKNADIKNKIKNTCFKKYGVDWYSKSKKFKEEINEIWYNRSKEEIKEIEKNRITTNIKKYGCKYGFQKNPNNFTEIHKKVIEVLKNKYNLKVKVEFPIGNYFVDILIGKNIIIEVNGDFWHANPQKYKKDDILNFPGHSVKASDIWERDKKRKMFIEKNNYRVFYIWEDEIKNENLFNKKIKDILIKGNVLNENKINQKTKCN